MRRNNLRAFASLDGATAALVLGYTVQAASGNAYALIESGCRTGGWHVRPSPDPGAASGGTTFADGALAFWSAHIGAVGTDDGQGGMKTFVPHYSG
jgi:hypothetical protein